MLIDPGRQVVERDPSAPRDLFLLMHDRAVPGDAENVDHAAIQCSVVDVPEEALQRIRRGDAKLLRDLSCRGRFERLTARDPPPTNMSNNPGNTSFRSVRLWT